MKAGGSNIRNVFKITVKVARENWSSAQNVTVGKVLHVGNSNHFGFKLSSAEKTKKGEEDGKKSEGYDVFEIEGCYTRPPYTYVDTFVDKPGEKRMNFQNYTVSVDDGHDTVKDPGVDKSKTEDFYFTMCVNAQNAGMVANGGHGKMEIWPMHPDLTIDYITGTSTILDSDIIEYNASGSLQKPNLSKTGYTLKSGQEWKRNSDNKIFAAGQSNAATTYKDFSDGAKFTELTETFTANWIPNTYTVVYNGNQHTRRKYGE